MFLLLIIFSSFAVQATTSSCETARVQSEASFRHRHDLKARQQAELDLKHALESCASSAGHSRLERRLQTVQEEIATTHLQIALFYPHADGVGLLKGALSHLRIIDQNYPNFSRMDRVLFLLGDYSDRTGDAHDAANYFRRVIARYPRNACAAEARKRLAQLTANGET
jgi:outer membrane protein assembly factor BamD (BamD/ComL family)